MDLRLRGSGQGCPLLVVGSRFAHHGGRGSGKALQARADKAVHKPHQPEQAQVPECDPLDLDS